MGVEQRNEIKKKIPQHSCFDCCGAEVVVVHRPDQYTMRISSSLLDAHRPSSCKTLYSLFLCVLCTSPLPFPPFSFGKGRADAIASITGHPIGRRKCPPPDPPAPEILHYDAACECDALAHRLIGPRLVTSHTYERSMKPFRASKSRQLHTVTNRVFSSISISLY